MTVSAMLRAARDLHDADPGHLELVSVAGDALRVSAGASLLSEGRTSAVCFMLVEGEVELHLDREGTSIHLRRVEVGELFGHDALLCHEAQRWSARALSATTLLRFDASTIGASLDRGGPLSTFLHERMAVSSSRQLRDANALLHRSESLRPSPIATEDAAAQVDRLARQLGVEAEVLDLHVTAVPDLGAGWKRR